MTSSLFPRIDYGERRERLLRELGGGVAVIAAAPELVRGRDGEVRYRPDPVIHYLTGFGEPGAVAVLTPHDPDHRLTLFVRPRDPERETWDGPRAGVDGAREHHGADAAYPVEELREHLKGLLEPADAIWYSLGSDAELDELIPELLRGFRRGRPRAGRGPDALHDPATLIDPMRRVKDPAEIARIRAAAAATMAGHRAGIGAASPGVGEWQVEAAVDHAFRVAHCTAGASFQTIVGSGPNATILHYRSNQRILAAGDLVLLDAGAEVELYCGDVTRTFPASGRFTPEQRALYEVVLAAERAAIHAAGPGALFGDLHDAARRVLAAGMLELGLLEGSLDEVIETGAYKRYYMHQTSHWLGLEVHDVGSYRESPGSHVALQAGMVLTIEPGIYVRADDEDAPPHFRGMGIRIEDDVLVSDTGREVLTADLPTDPDDVESLLS